MVNQLCFNFPAEIRASIAATIDESSNPFTACGATSFDSINKKDRPKAVLNVPIGGLFRRREDRSTDCDDGKP